MMAKKGVQPINVISQCLILSSLGKFTKLSSGQGKMAL
jgi:hypothetical protein